MAFAVVISLALILFLQGILNEVWKHKLIFVETPDANETSIALENYRRVSGRVYLCTWLFLNRVNAGMRQR